MTEQQIRAELSAMMVECLEQRDGRYYATEAGAAKIQGWLKDHGIECPVTVVDGRFEL